MNDEYKPIPSSIIAEGIDIWHGAGDRGDGAMIAYGVARYALARGDKKEAMELWPLLQWCLEYCRRNLNEEGVVASDSDELENRFPSGDANLTTSCLYYDALLSASYLGKELGKPAAELQSYRKQARELRQAIEKYFGGNVEGFNTYKYYKENEVLRSWICIPLTVGIYDRKEETIEALFSPRLWTENGLLTQGGSSTYWDVPLYPCAACWLAEKRKGWSIFHATLSNGCCEHVPYAIEAWPEGIAPLVGRKRSLLPHYNGRTVRYPPGSAVTTLTPITGHVGHHLLEANQGVWEHIRPACHVKQKGKDRAVIDNKPIVKKLVRENETVTIRLTP